MNKKIKIIDILNMIATGELKDKTRFKVYSSCNDENDKPILCEYDEDYPGIIWCVADNKNKFNYKIDYMRILNYYVEILEDNTEELEELPELADCEERNMKINELVKAVNEIRKEINK